MASMPVAESAEITCLAAITEARAAFFDALCEMASRHIQNSNQTKINFPNKRNDPIPLLRSENTYQIAQFLFLLKALELYGVTKFKLLIERHNADMEKLSQDETKMMMQGLDKPYVEAGIFNDIQKQKILESFNDTVILDQSDFAKFMTPFMSPETCRNTLRALEFGGFLARRGGIQKLIYSSGILEASFEAHLKRILEKVGAVRDGR